METEWLSEEALSDFFTCRESHPKVLLHRLPRARVLWINWRAAQGDPKFVSLGKDADAYARHLLQSCAHRVCQEGGHGVEPMVATADRYGGGAIGFNGGSGRSAFLNGYHVKGVGRTSLVGIDSDQAHSSGGAYLEECVREAIASEIVHSEFPCGALPILAILDTGEHEVWKTEKGDVTERRCLLVRPPFLRPAHFLRASLFSSGLATEGMLDAERVREMFLIACRRWSVPAVARVFRQFWIRWARQSAHGYISRFAHGGGSPSNVALDGRLLDFGGVSALPNLARFTTMEGSGDVGEELLWLSEELHRQWHTISRYAPRSLTNEFPLRSTLDAVRYAFGETAISELLRLLGFTKLQAKVLLSSKNGGRIGQAARVLLVTLQLEKSCIFEATPDLPWVIPTFWAENLHPVLKRLRLEIERSPVFCNLPDFHRYGLSKRLFVRSLPRRECYREIFKAGLHSRLDGKYGQDELFPEHVSSVLNQMVSGNRRDSTLELDSFIPVGFARGNFGEYQLGLVPNSIQMHAICEWGIWPTEDRLIPLPVTDFSNSHVRVDGALDAYQSCVRLHGDYVMADLPSAGRVSSNLQQVQ